MISLTLSIAAYYILSSCMSCLISYLLSVPIITVFVNTLLFLAWTFLTARLALPTWNLSTSARVILPSLQNVNLIISFLMLFWSNPFSGLHCADNKVQAPECYTEKLFLTQLHLTIRYPLLQTEFAPLLRIHSSSQMYCTVSHYQKALHSFSLDSLYQCAKSNVTPWPPNSGKSSLPTHAKLTVHSFKLILGIHMSLFCTKSYQIINASSHVQFPLGLELLGEKDRILSIFYISSSDFSTQQF